MDDVEMNTEASLSYQVRTYAAMLSNLCYGSGVEYRVKNHVTKVLYWSSTKVNLHHLYQSSGNTIIASIHLVKKG
jgi:hypothetical protein